ncbi:MAG: bifunctional (p)ppGpp synthetase/guanosine-3',5'-bis(diphosphate) 3'-pyrophosphohydrolase [Muribaculaceae bacterium]|nr:bifunctional (p)ppGpp synthetase/guanosine-3',5'-bis(diphosphate) 3'-pyrophosphohydrolase [Muribaculaceae bacterium]
MPDNKLNSEELTYIKQKLKDLLKATRPVLVPGDLCTLKGTLIKAHEQNGFERNAFGQHPLLTAFDTIAILCDMVAPDRTLIVSTLLQTTLNEIDNDIESIRKQWGDDIALTVSRLLKVQQLYRKHTTVESENFKRLLLTFAEDIRVIILMIVGRLALMRSINHHPDEDAVRQVAGEARYLYAALAHRLGLYTIKSELEDLSLKYTEREIYTSIAKKLNETKTKRDEYIKNFIEPVKARLEAEGLRFDIKGRTKSIFSIWNKIKKQRVDLDHIYDLFAIRIIIDTVPEREKAECWLAYSVITDMFRPNPARMKDWISIPKANGYESLHTTVYGPDERWVEVQIRTRRMDEVAEKGLAAHWRYKGIKAEANLDTWMSNVRDILETAESGPMELMKNMKMDVYNREVFVFTPKGDLYNLPAGATLLDFAFHIHTGLGAQCTGGRVNGKARKINYKLESGDTVEIMTSPNQQPNQGWLNIAITSKARNKIRAALKDSESRAADLGKELLQRRFKNRKIDYNEALMTKVIKKLGYKDTIRFFSDLGDNTLDVGTVVDNYVSLMLPENENNVTVSADEFVLNTAHDDTEDSVSDSDVLIIGNDIKGINYRMAKCCNPIFGDDVFGFISAEGVVKIHRNDCPNASNIRAKYPYRVIKTRWSGKFAGQMAVTLRILGNDDIGIVTNITSIITKESNTSLRNISIDSHDGLFQGFLVVGVNDTQSLNNLIKKIKTVKGVKDVQRSN